MQISPLSTHSNAFAYLRYKFPQMVDSFADIPVLELTYSEWDEYSLTGYGYLIKKENIDNTESQISNYSEAMLDQYRLTNPEVNRDLHIYDFYKKIGATPFFLILEGNEAAIIHEVAHVVWDKLSPEEQSGIDLPEVSAPDNDQYLQSDHERFTHMTEMEYFKSQGMSFDDYFRLHNAREYKLINDPNADPKLKELSQMDYNDYRQIWDHAKTSSSCQNWFTKLAQTLTVTTGTHDKTNRPIYILQGPTYPIKGKLGRSGLGFNYWRPVGWWMYQDRMSPNVSTGLQSLGFDLSVLGGSPAPGIPETQVGAGPPVEPATVAPVAPTGVTDQSWEDTQPKSKWYGFPIKKPIYETMVPVEVEGQQIELKVSLGRWFKKGRRRVPSYVYDIFFNDEIIGRLAKSSPGDWGTYDEGEIAGAITEIIQARIALGSKSKMYNGLTHVLQLSGRNPELTAYLKQFEKYGDGRQTIDKTIHLDEPGYEGDYPVKFFAYSEGINWYGDTALEHPQAPRPKTIFYIGDVPPNIHNIEQFNQWLDEKINNPEIMERAKRGYLDYLKSFHFTEEEQEEARGQFAEILPIIEGRVTDANFFRSKLIEHGYIRANRRRRRTGPGMQPQDKIDLVLDRVAIQAVTWDSSQLSRSPNYFYGALAYYMLRFRSDSTTASMHDSPAHAIGMNINTFARTLNRHGLDISFEDLRSYMRSLAISLLDDLFDHKVFGQPFVDDDNSPMSSISLDPFIQFVVLHGIDENFARENPVKAYRTLALQFHPDRNPGNPEAENLFVQLGNLWDAVPIAARKSADSWLCRICFG